MESLAEVINMLPEEKKGEIAAQVQWTVATTVAGGPVIQAAMVPLRATRIAAVIHTDSTSPPRKSHEHGACAGGMSAGYECWIMVLARRPAWRFANAAMATWTSYGDVRMTFPHPRYQSLSEYLHVESAKEVVTAGTSVLRSSAEAMSTLINQLHIDPAALDREPQLVLVPGDELGHPQGAQAR